MSLLRSHAPPALVTLGLVLTTVVLMATGCGTGGTASEPASTTSTALIIPGPLEDYSLDLVDVADRSWLVAVADTPRLRTQGLMGVDDLGSLDGMLFVFDADTTARFHMEDTLIPLDIAFFTAEGELVSVSQMTPCDRTPCERYAADGPYRYALEAALGELVDLPADVTLGLGSG